MNQRVNQQMAACNNTEELAVDHMCDPSQWMPVSRVKSGERRGITDPGYRQNKSALPGFSIQAALS